jgi:hypothetical protein
MARTLPVNVSRNRGCYGCCSMATASSEPLAQRLAAIRDQLKLLADYL